MLLIDGIWLGDSFINFFLSLIDDIIFKSTEIVLLIVIIHIYVFYLFGITGKVYFLSKLFLRRLLVITPNGITAINFKSRRLGNWKKCKPNRHSGKETLHFVFIIFYSMLHFKLIKWYHRRGTQNFCLISIFYIIRVDMIRCTHIFPFVALMNIWLILRYCSPLFYCLVYGIYFCKVCVLFVEFQGKAKSQVIGLLSTFICPRRKIRLVTADKRSFWRP